MVEGATAWLEAHIDFINSLNVYPVPDGDTGINMYLTMQAALREIGTVEDSSVSAVAQALAHGALMGARGNSGVILSQVWRGLAKHLDGKESLAGSDFALALREGAATAYKGVMRPVEGTILTVAREAADEAVLAAGERNDLTHVLGRALAQAESTLARTPDLLPVLKEAGVVDAGGQGLCAILEGMLRYLRGEQGPMVSVAKTRPRAGSEPVSEGDYGYDVQFLVFGRDLPIDEIRETIMSMGDSVLVVGDQDTIKVHVHSDDPGRIITYATSKGALRDMVVENMQEQYQEFVAERARRPTPAVHAMGDIATIAVVNGTGLCNVFESLGAGAVVLGGQSMNPSTEELLKAISELPSDKVVVLPNNPNVVLAAQQAQQMSDKEVAVIPTKTVPQGISALLAFNYQSDLRTNVDLMERAAGQIQTVEITNAVRSVRIDGLRIEKGQFIALLNGKLIKASDSVRQVARDALRAMDIGRYDIVTVYWGDAVTREEAEELASWMGTHYPDQEIELVEGNQPHYHYIISVE
ncbi:MAG TPA: DAK2 domain-containing protein [Anaerolineae bacterium]|nr:DAK2 domain-containing protein [Anaerolineae bacterium]